jgi:hypothetical protein
MVVASFADYLHPVEVAVVWRSQLRGSKLVTLPSKTGREAQWLHLASVTLEGAVNDLLDERS